MAIMRKYALKENYVQVPNHTAKAVEKNLSLQSLGLIVNLWSYNVEAWELHKTELYKRYIKNKKTSVTSAWDELVEQGYIIEFKFRDGRKWEYVYYYRIDPFSEEEKSLILEECAEEYGLKSTADFQQLKFNSSKRTVQNTHISNTELKKDVIKEIKTKEIKNHVNINDNSSEYQNSKEYYKKIGRDFYYQFAPGRWSKEQYFFNLDNLLYELFDENKLPSKIESPSGYIYGCLDNMAKGHDYKNGKSQLKTDNSKPFYDWMREKDDNL